MRKLFQATLLLCFALACSLALAQGTLFIHGGGTFSREARSYFSKLAGGEQARLVVIPTANEPHEANMEALVRVWTAFGIKSVTILHTDSRREAMDPAFAEPLHNATAVWISGGRQTILAEMYLGTPVENELYALIQCSGVIGGSSAGAGIMSKTMLVKDVVEQGFDLLPNAIIDQHFVVRKREPRLLRRLQQYPELLGIGIDENTAAIVQGDSLRVLGASTVSIYLAEHGNAPAYKQELRNGETLNLKPLRDKLKQR